MTAFILLRLILVNLLSKNDMKFFNSDNFIRDHDFDLINDVFIVIVLIVHFYYI